MAWLLRDQRTKGSEKMSKLKQGSMREFINNIHTKLREDEILMRLLHYKPRDSKTKRPDPLDVSLPDITTSKNYWDIIEEKIMTATKSSDIEEKAICRIYLYEGRRRPKFDSYLLVDQEIVIDVLVHESYQSDLRMSWICDRINELIALEYIAGYGKLTYVAGNPRQAPIGYSKYENVYEFRGNTKP
jgi:hypothetical protein